MARRWGLHTVPRLLPVKMLRTTSDFGPFHFLKYRAALESRQTCLASLASRMITSDMVI